MHELGERMCEGADGMILVVMNDVAKEAGAFTDDIDWG